MIGRRTTGDDQIVVAITVRRQRLFQLNECADDVVANGSEQNEFGVAVAQIQLHGSLERGQFAFDEALRLLNDSADLLWTGPGCLAQSVVDFWCGARCRLNGLRLFQQILCLFQEICQRFDQQFGCVTNELLADGF